MQSARNMKEYRAELRSALGNSFLRETLDNFATSYRANRAAIFEGIDEQELIAEIAAAKDEALGRLDELYAQFAAEAAKRGVTVHLAQTAAEANELILEIARANDCRRIIKSKSMTAEEIRLNQALEGAGLEVTETDLGEWIIQLRQEGPSHMVLPAIHLSRGQVAEVFSQVTGRPEEGDISSLVRVARTELRARFFEADMGITGANFAVAENGAIGLCTNEGNARLTSTLPRVQVALCGLDKLAPTLHEALRIIKVLARNATAQAITNYVSWITGRVEYLPNPDQKKIYHVVFLDNGRRALAQDPVCGQALRCIRCGACANVCPVFRLVGGHRMGHIYIGAIGLILTYFFHGPDQVRNLIQNCIGCEACKTVCGAGIDLPAVIMEIRARLNRREGAPPAVSLVGAVMKNRKLFHALLRAGQVAQKPVTGRTRFVRHLPDFLIGDQNFKALPALADVPFRDQWADLAPGLPAGDLSIGLFAGCAQDFIYPEQLKAGLKLLVAKGCRVIFPLEQSCCGLPLYMMGDKETAESLAARNIRAFAEAGCDYIVSLCASCVSHMKRNYQALALDLMADQAESYCGKIIDFSSLMVNVLNYGPDDFQAEGREKTGLHLPCHLVRGLGVGEEPRRLIRAAGEYVPSPEEDVCCGFGGSYSLKIPEISGQLMANKLQNLEASGAAAAVTDCPGCVMQLRGGEEKRGRGLEIRHLAEFLAERLKK